MCIYPIHITSIKQGKCTSCPFLIRATLRTSVRRGGRVVVAVVIGAKAKPVAWVVVIVIVAV